LDAGEVVSIVGDQVVVKATSKAPAMGSAVFNERGGKVGSVQDIIGPVEKPYFIIKPLNAAVKLKAGDRVRSN
jgi:rRNA processing protein Gar1